MGNRSSRASQSTQSPSTIRTVKELTINDLPLLCNTLNPVASKCFALGLQLGVEYSQLCTIENDYRKSKDQLREIISERLKQDSPLTWHDIVTALRSPTVGENRLASQIEQKHLLQTMGSHSPVVSGPSDMRHYRSQSPVRGPSDRGHYRSQSPVRGASDRGHYRSQSPVRGPSDRGHYRSQSPMRGPSDRGHYRSQSPVRGPSDRGHYRSQSPMRGPSDRGHYRSQSPVMGPSDRGHYRSQSPVREPSDRGHYRSQSPVRGPSDREQPQYLPPPTPTHTSPYLTLQMSQFIDYVKTIYRSSEVERDTKVVKWPPTPSKVFINLACIDRASVRRRDYDEITKAMVRDGNVDVILENKRPMLLNEVARDVPAADSIRRVILVEGAPGVGKSTFAWEFCRRWERGEIAQQYQLVLLLRLRDQKMSRAKSLRDLIYHPLEGVSEAVSLEVIATHGLHALIILEGYDELPERCRSDQCLFPQFIAGKVLPLATIMVTSRPWATGSIRYSHGSRMHQHIEILGFTNQQITQYIESTLPPDQVSDLSLYLERHPPIRMCMYIPLNSAIVVTVYQESQAGTVCALPTTRTELYTALARTLLLRYLRGHPEYESGTKPMKTFKDLPRVVYGKFSELSKLAYSSIAGSSSRHVQLIFNDSDLPSDFDSLGFMDSVTELYVTQGTVSSHNFLHLTFQEFFAAVHISTMSPSDQLKHFQRHKDGSYRVVLRFLAGLTKMSCFSKDTIKKVFPNTKRTSSPFSVGCDVDVTIDLVNWMFETHNDDVISLLEGKTVNITTERSALPLDYYSLGYCIAHSQCQWVLSLYEGIGEEEVRMIMARASTRQETSIRVGLKGAGLYKPLSMSAKCLNMLFTQWKSVLHLHDLHLDLPVPCDVIPWPDLSGLRVLNLRIRGGENWRLDTLLPHLSLKSLSIISCTVKGGGLVFEDCDAIGLHIKSTTCLKELCMGRYNSSINIIDDKGMEVISEALADNQTLPLERLELESCGTFTDIIVDCLIQLITNTTTLQHLTIHDCTFSVHGLLALAQASYHSSTLQEKILKELTVTVNGDNEAKDFVQLLVEYPYMVNNEYVHNISDTGAAALAQALHHNSTLKMLDLSDNDAIGKEGIHQLVQALTVNTSIPRATLIGGGLILPKRCEEYATQCTQYKAVKTKIQFC